MNDLEHEIRETLRRHEGDMPSLVPEDARDAAGGARRRQIVNVASTGAVTLVLVIGLVAGLGELVRADRSPTVLDTPSPSQTRETEEADDVHGWPGRTRNSAGIYSWGEVYPYVTRVVRQGASLEKRTVSSITAFMHNGYRPGSGAVSILIGGDPGRLNPHRGQTAVTVAGLDGTYRRFIADEGQGGVIDGPSEEWMVDIQGTTVTITLTAKPRAPTDEVAEAREIIRSSTSTRTTTDSDSG